MRRIGQLPQTHALKALFFKSPSSNNQIPPIAIGGILLSAGEITNLGNFENYPEKENQESHLKEKFPTRPLHSASKLRCPAQESRWRLRRRNRELFSLLSQLRYRRHLRKG